VRVLITGGAGFVGTHLVDHCLQAGDEVAEVSLDGPDDASCRRIRGDLRDPSVALGAVREFGPERVCHLAALASVGASWTAPAESITSNVASTVNLLDAVRAGAPSARVLLVSSGAVYGPPVRSPITEEHPTDPQSPYAAGKLAGESLAAFYADTYGVDCLRMRAFNHAGPGQSEEYVVSAFARQIAEAERDGAGELVLRTGDLRPRRDFTDVRDVVRAYRLALEEAPAGIYNVCSGRGLAIGEIVGLLAARTGLSVDTRANPALLREREVLEILGSHERLTAETGWVPEIDIEVTLADTLAWWRAALARA
jgi:GDP-4-dehydro-6-deoxy-D-mannose reductase